MMQEAVHAVEIDETFNFNGPEDDADDVFEDTFEIEEIDAIGDFEDFDEDDF